MIEAHGLRKEYPGPRGPVVAVDDISFKIGTGEFVAVNGRSGSGKSTLLALLGGLTRPTHGRVIVDGVDPWSLMPRDLAAFRARRVGFLLQSRGLLPSLRAIDNVALPALFPEPGDLAGSHARATMLLGDVGLSRRLEAYPGELSGGEQCRVALARALMNDPPLILADEPTGDLDEKTELEIVERLVTLHRDRGTTLVLVTHSPELARRADRILLLRAGRLEEAATLPVQVVAWAPRPAVASAPPGEIASPAPLGEGLTPLVRRYAVWATVVVATILGLNFAVAGIQQRMATERQTARDELQRRALQQLHADVEDVAQDGESGYRVTLSLRNLEPRRELFVLGPAVRVFIQADGGWKEVPSQPTDGAAGVNAVTGRQPFVVTFRPELTTFEEQIAGSYHVRIASTMLVSRTRDPGDDLVDRTDAYYVYLKPHGADDADLRRRNGWSGTPPLWIPMPAH
jgi:putative ABC transport system ATP-binding protein/macrolide transport system ATP-binding/permease protein/lipoprotein-releasing system ATP-binding protein